MNCHTRKGDTKDSRVLEGQYGDWLRADSGRINTRKLIHKSPTKESQHTAGSEMRSNAVVRIDMDQAGIGSSPIPLIQELVISLPK